MYVYVLYIYETVYTYGHSVKLYC